MKDEIIEIRHYDEEKTEYVTEKQPIETTNENGEKVVEEQDIRKEVKTTVKKTYAKATRTVSINEEGRHELIRKEYAVTTDGEKGEPELLAEIAKISELKDVEEA